MGTLKFRHTTINSQEFLLSTKEKKEERIFYERKYNNKKKADSACGLRTLLLIILRYTMIGRK